MSEKPEVLALVDHLMGAPLTRSVMPGGDMSDDTSTNEGEADRYA